VGEAALVGEDDLMPILSVQAENVLVPTLQLATQLSQAYDQLRKHSKSLANFTEGRTDPVTGMGNSLALEEQLELQLADRTGGSHTASLVLISANCDAASSGPHEPGRELTRTIAGHIEHCVRENDYIARIGGNDFAVVLSNTPLAGARVFGTRLRSRLELQMGILANCGVAEALPGDSPRTLMSRADSALYSARADRPGAQYLHSGSGIQADRPLVPTGDRGEGEAARELAEEETL
jgi:diguanylate cyclase (GGDEF)-like protein